MSRCDDGLMVYVFYECLVVSSRGVVAGFGVGFDMVVSGSRKGAVLCDALSIRFGGIEHVDLE